MNKLDVKNGLEFYFDLNKLKTLIRQGAVKWKVNRPRLESVAEHIALTETLAIALANQLNLTKKMDMGYLLTMINFHEIGELNIGDLTIYDNVPANKKHESELNYAKQLLAKLKNSKFFVDMLKDFNSSTSFEAKFAKACDRLENVLEFKKYCDLHQVSLSNASAEMLNFPPVKTLLEQHKNMELDELWYRYHLSSFAMLGFKESDWEIIKNIKIN